MKLAIEDLFSSFNNDQIRNDEGGNEANGTKGEGCEAKDLAELGSDKNEGKEDGADGGEGKAARWARLEEGNLASADDIDD